MAVRGDVVAGYVFEPNKPDVHWTVELIVGARPVALARADLDVEDATPEGLGVGRHGFELAIPRNLDRGSPAEVRLVNLGRRLGEPFVLPPDRRAGEVRWRGGLRLEGWVNPSNKAPPSVHAWVGNARVASAQADRRGGASRGGNQLGFSLWLPDRFADGDAHVVEIRDADGHPLSGSPQVICAFPNGLVDFLRERGVPEGQDLRAALFDRLVPQSLPFSMFEPWRARHPLMRRGGAPLSSALVLIGHDPAPTIESLEAEDSDWTAAHLTPPAGQFSFEPDSLVQFLETDAALATTVVFALTGTRFYPGGYAALAESAREPGVAVAYADYAIADLAGALHPIALPRYSEERMLEQGYFAPMFASPRSVALRAARSGASDIYALAFAAIADIGALGNGVRALAGFAAEIPALDRIEGEACLARASSARLAGRGVEASVNGAGRGALFPAVRVNRVPAKGLVSILIPTRDRVDLLSRCLASLEPARSRRQTEVIIIDNGSRDPETLRYLRARVALGDRVLPDEGPFNYSRLNNRAAAVARGDALCLLNNDVEALDGDWLEEMMGRLSAPDVGVVGAKLIWPSQVVQHGGVVLSPNLGATHAFDDIMDDSRGYADLMCVAREVSAVTGACLLTRREDYLASGGLDEVNFPINFNDVDYCLRLLGRGWRVLFTPHAKLLHEESASRGADLQTDRRHRLRGELRALLERWPDWVAKDPFYSPVLALDGQPYLGLHWAPTPRRDSRERVGMSKPGQF